MKPSWRLRISRLLGLGLSLRLTAALPPKIVVPARAKASVSNKTWTSDQASAAAGKPAKTATMDRDFPDPCILQDADGTWYAFATASGGKQIQAARAGSAAGPWTYVDRDVLPDPGAWTTGDNTWAPSVQRIAEGQYVMYYAGQVGERAADHCIGVATAATALGPYKAAGQPLACDLGSGGAIDPSGFLDGPTGRRYVAYKVDGNSAGHGGSCNNAAEPQVATPIMLQEVSAHDGTTPVGAPVQILDREDAADGPLVEAPSLAYVPGGGSGGGSGLYILFYSNHCWSTPGYAVNYATASSLGGPYTRSGQALMKSGDFGLTAPGGANNADNNSGGAGRLVFHANCPQGRCMFEADYTVRDGKVSIS